MLILDKLWSGDLDPSGRPLSQRPTYSRCQGEVLEAEERLMEVLAPEEKTRLEDYDTAWATQAAALEQDAFFTGFRLAGLLLLDILGGAQ